MGALQCSIIIPVFNQMTYTKGCLEALIATCKSDSDCEVIVVDNGSTDETELSLQFVTLHHPFIRYHRMAQNVGFNRACNFGAEQARGEYLIFLNNDTIPQSGWLEAMISAGKEPQVGLAGCKLVYPESYSINHAGYVYSSELGGFYHLYHRFPQSFHGANKEREFQALLGACIIIGRKLFFDVGGFALYGLEDIDLSLKVREKRQAVLYSPKGTVMHYGSVTLINSPGGSYPETDLAAFNARWPKARLANDHIRFYMEDGLIDPKSSLPSPDQITGSLKKFHQARALHQNGKLNEALTLLKESVILFNYNLEASLELVCQLIENGAPEDAIAESLRLIELEPRCYEAYFHARQIYSGLGKSNDAGGIIQRLLALNDLPEAVRQKANGYI